MCNPLAQFFSSICATIFCVGKKGYENATVNIEDKCLNPYQAT